MRISFKAKPQTVYNMDDSIAWVYVKVPKLNRSHVDMCEARQSPRYGHLANSDLFPGVLDRISKQRFPTGYLKLTEALPEGVTVRQIGPLVEVSFQA